MGERLRFIMARQSILITGCSSGIGLDTAITMQKRGWLVVASCRKQQDCDALRTQYGLDTVLIDYEKPETIETGLADALVKTGGRLDVLFNNGAYAIPAAVEDLPTDALRAIFEANFFGWHSLTRAVIPLMRQQNSGRIIQNSSVLGFAAMRFRGAYNATKFALEGLTDTMRLELHGSGIKMILVEPGPIRTRIRENAYIQFQRWIKWEGTALEAMYRKGLIPRLSAIDPPKDTFELQVDAVTKAVIHAAESKRPKLRYRVTTATSLMMIAKRILSSRALDAVARRM
jgi:NAD(P)-dependent dehydrogenase (short-subunit alcohol dehydrogenase family)